MVSGVGWPINRTRLHDPLGGTNTSVCGGIKVGSIRVALAAQGLDHIALEAPFISFNLRRCNQCRSARQHVGEEIL
jgi:hypothetical protein